MAPIAFPSLSSYFLSHEIANSTLSVKQQPSTSPSRSSFSASISTSSLHTTSPVISTSNSAAPSLAVLPHPSHEKFSINTIPTPATTYTSYIELNNKNNAYASTSRSLPNSTPISIADSYPMTVEQQAPHPNNTGRDFGIMIGCVIGVIILGFIGWVYMLRARQHQRTRRKKKRKGKGKGKFEAKFGDGRKKHSRRRRRRVVGKKVVGGTVGEAPAAEGA